MKKLSVQRVLVFLLLSVLLWVVFYWLYEYVASITHQVLSPPAVKPFWINWIHELYPRLATEQQRFSESFFVSKGRQVVLRLSLTVQLVIIYYSFSTWLAPLLKRTSAVFNSSLNNKYVFALTAMLYASLLLVVYNAILEFQGLIQLSPFYTPTGIGKFLLPVFPSLTVLWLLYLLMIGSIVTVVCLPKKWISSSIAALCFLYYQLILFGFGKYDHGFSTLTYALLVYPFFLWEQEHNKQSTYTPAWSIVLIQFLIALSYLYSALEKLLISGIDWFYSNNLQQHLLLRPSKVGYALAQQETLCYWLSAGVIVLQMSFILLPFYKKLRILILPAGFIFHTAAWLLLGAGGWFNPWWAMYLFFLFPLQSQETK